MLRVANQTLPDFPNEMPNNYIVLKGAMRDNYNNYYPLKIILPTDYPKSAPRCYYDMQLTSDIIQRLTYLNNQNQISISYLQMWNA
jgi:hypothetical protein